MTHFVSFLRAPASSAAIGLVIGLIIVGLSNIFIVELPLPISILCWCLALLTAAFCSESFWPPKLGGSRSELADAVAITGAVALTTLVMLMTMLPLMVSGAWLSYYILFSLGCGVPMIVLLCFGHAWLMCWVVGVDWREEAKETAPQGAQGAVQDG